MNPVHRQLKISCAEQWLGGRFVHIIPHGDGLMLNQADYAIGRYCLPAIDAGENGFHWGRVVLDTWLPRDSFLKVYAYASDYRPWGDWEDLDQGLREWNGDWPELTRQLFGPPVSHGSDFYLKLTGRYLWLMFELIATGEEAPEIRSVRIHMGGDHMVDYLPAIYQGEDFTGRFLSIFDSMLMDMEWQIEDLPQRLDYENTDREMLEYLASWVCAEGEDPETLKERIATALPDYETQYTAEGIRRTIRRLTGKDAYIIEHFNVSPNRPDCSDPVLYRKLYGEDPYRFFVLMEENAFAGQQEMEQFLRQMEERIPAGTELELVLLKQGIQLGWHTYLGLNSRVGGYVPAVVDQNITIHYDTMIGGTNHES